MCVSNYILVKIFMGIIFMGIIWDLSLINCRCVDVSKWSYKINARRIVF